MLPREQLEEQLETIVRNDGDDTLNIPSFFDRVMVSIEANGLRFTETCYGLPHSFVIEVNEYMNNSY